MPSCEAVQIQLHSLYICRPLVNRHLKKSCTCADRMVSLFTKVTSFGLGCYPCLVRIYSSRRCSGGGCFWQRLTRAWRPYVVYGFWGPVTLQKECVQLLPRRNLALVVWIARASKVWRSTCTLRGNPNFRYEFRTFLKPWGNGALKFTVSWPRFLINGLHIEKYF